ncbi:MAG: PAS domain S-box protein, partial [bacterium]
MDRSFKGGEVTPSDWAIMIFKDNVVASGELEANASGKSYQVSFEAAPAVYADPSQATKTGDALLVEVRRKDGSEFPAEIALTPIETSLGRLVVASIQDLTPRKAAEAALRASEH